MEDMAFLILPALRSESDTWEPESGVGHLAIVLNAMQAHKEEKVRLCENVAA